MNASAIEIYEDVAEKITVATLAERVNNHIKFFWGVAAIFGIWLGGISYALYSINGEIGTLRLPQKLQQSAISPDSEKSQAQALEVINKATEGNTPLPVAVVASAGNSFVRESTNHIEAWAVALRLASYRSYLSSSEITIPPVGAVAPNTRYNILAPPGAQLPKLSAVKKRPLPIESAAIWEEIGQHLNINNQIGDGLLIADGGVITLDGAQLRHVILQNVEVHYSGHPTMLEDVLFLNCKFVMDNTDPGRQMIAKIINDPQISFSWFS